MVRSGVVGWPPEFERRYRDAGYWTGVPLGSLPRSWADREGAAVAITDGATRITYQELAERIDILASELLRRGLGRGDNIVIQMPNCWQFVVMFFACQRIGVAPALALAQHREHELTAITRRVGARAIVVVRHWRGYDHHALASRVADATPWPVVVLVTDTDGSVVAGEAGQPTRLLRSDPDSSALDAHSPDPADAAFFLMSGGTTGVPKIIARTHDDYGYSVRCSAEACGYDGAVVFLAVLPMAHGLTLGGPGVLGALSVGGRVVIAASPNPDVAFPWIAAEQVSTTAVTPAVALRWLLAADASEHDLSSLDLLQIAGAALPRKTAIQVEPRLGCRLQQVFGMSEGLHCYTRAGDGPEVVVSTQGRPMSAGDELMVVDPAGTPLPVGEIGELLVRGPTTIRGYFNEPDSTSFTPDGWYRTGDLVSRDGSGNITVRGRTKHVVNRGGEKISAEEVDRVVRSLDAVAQSSIVPVDDPELGERVCACVVLHPGRTLTLSHLRDACRQAGLAEFKAPERLEQFTSLPLSPVGKVDLKELRSLVRARTIAVP